MSITIIAAPTNLGLTATGVEQAPQALLDLGLAKRLDAKVVHLPVPTRTGKHVSDILNADAIVNYNRAIERAVEDVMYRGKFPLVLGGDCTVLLGAGRALLRGSGLLYIDGHQDYYTARTSPSGEAADMVLALATGTGPSILSRTTPDTKHPLFDIQRVVAVGYRDEADARRDGCPNLAKTEATTFSLAQMTKLGENSTRRIHTKLPWVYWTHFDADVLSDAAMPAVDYRQPSGLSAAAVTHLLRDVHKYHTTGMSVSCYNPTLDDAQMSAGKTLVDILTSSLAQ